MLAGWLVRVRMWRSLISTGTGAEVVAKEVRSTGRRALAIECDVTNRSAVLAMGEQVLQEFGAIHALVNNAGVYPIQAWTEIDEEEWGPRARGESESLFPLCTGRVSGHETARLRKDRQHFVRCGGGWDPEPPSLCQCQSRSPLVLLGRSPAKPVQTESGST